MDSSEPGGVWAPEPADRCDCHHVCVQMFDDLKAVVQDDVPLPSEKLDTVEYSTGCATWTWWFIGLTIAEHVLVFVIGICLAFKK